MDAGWTDNTVVEKFNVQFRLKAGFFRRVCLERGKDLIMKLTGANLNNIDLQLSNRRYWQGGSG